MRSRTTLSCLAAATMAAHLVDRLRARLFDACFGRGSNVLSLRKRVLLILISDATASSDGYGVVMRVRRGMSKFNRVVSRRSNQRKTLVTKFILPSACAPA